MACVEILPLSGIRVNGKKIALSASKKEVERVLGKPDRVWQSSCFYFGHELRFDFEKMTK